MASNIPGSQIPLLTLGIAVDYNLYLDINLKFQITNVGKLSEIFRDSISQQNIQQIDLNLTQSINQGIDYYSYSTLDSSVEIYGGIGMRLRIAQPGWLTTGLGFFYEDPMFLEGIWDYNISQSEGPMASTNGKISNIANTSITFTLVEIIDGENTTVENNNNIEKNDQTKEEKFISEETTESEGISGFEAKILFLGIILALCVTRRKM